MAELKHLLKTVPFQKIVQWDVKGFFGMDISSRYQVERLEKYVKRNTNKVKLSAHPETEFHILGISNEKGMFDAYSDLGKNIKQPYILVENQDIAYNPYRINVGSIGMKTEELKNRYISPAYMVFSCKHDLLSEYLFRVMKTKTFNGLVRENTTGSVRQTLSFDKLISIQIPVPEMKEQKRLIDRYNMLIHEAEQTERKADSLEDEMENYLFNILEIKRPEPERKSLSLLGTVSFQKMIKWGAEFGLQSVNPDNIFHSDKYVNVPLTSLYELNPPTKYPDQIENISFLPMECISDIYGEITELRDGRVIDAKGYSRFQEKDVLWAKITPCMQNGKCVIARGLRNGYGYGSTEYHVFRARKEKAVPEYIYCFLRTRALRKIAQTYFTGSAGQQRVGSDFIEMLTLPMLPVSSDKPEVLTQEIVTAHIFGLKDRIKELRLKAKGLYEKADQEFEEEIFAKGTPAEEL